MDANSQAKAIEIINRFEQGDPRVHSAPLEQSPFGWGDVKRKIIAEQLMDRVMGNKLPDQGGSSLCGPASFMYCLIQDRADLYAQYVVDLWENGEARLGSMHIRPSARLRNNTNAAISGARMDAVDWISLGSLRGFESGYDSPAGEFSAITYPKNMRRWFQALGCSLIGEDSTRLIGSTGLNKFLDVSCWVVSGWVLMFMNSNMINGNSGGFTPDHWVVVTQPILVNNYPVWSLLQSANNTTCYNHAASTPSEESDKWAISFAVFTWGGYRHIRQDVKRFRGNYYGTLAFTGVA